MEICLAQVSNFDNAAPPTVVPASPVAAALFHDIDIPVNYYTGGQKIAIPIYQVKMGALSVPISLSYRSGGIKVEEDAGWTGLSWDLEAGGAIGRTIIGRPDENSLSAPGGGGYRTGATSLGMPNGMDELGTDVWMSNLTNCQLQTIALGKTLELTPDNYFINICGNSARLFFDKDSHPYLSPYKPWKVTGNETSGFTVVTEDGTTYILNLIESSNTAISVSGQDDNTPPIVGNTSWYLTQMISANKTDTINFSYTSVGYSPKSYIPQESEGVLWPGQIVEGCEILPPVPPHTYTTSATTVSGYLLSSISTRNQRVDFIANANRSDIPNANAGLNYKLDSIKIYATGSGQPDQLLHKFSFGYDYYSSGPDLRLRLLSLLESDATGALPQSYNFTYYNNTLPAKTSMSQDLWGYYNGKANNTMIPTVTDAGGVTVAAMADRSVDTTQASLGLLKTIQYPTGGTTSFEYESNRSGKADPLYQSVTAGATTCFAATCPIVTAADTFYIPWSQQVTLAVANSEGLALVGEAYSEIYALGSTIPIQTYSTRGANDYQLVLGPGMYRIVATKSAGEDVSSSIHATWQIKVAAPYVGNPIGGSRVKRMVQSDGYNTIVKRFLYLLNDSVSSGKSMHTGVYAAFEYSPQYCESTKVGDWMIYTQHSVSLTAVGGVQGGAVGYTRVTVLNGDNGENGREEYYYTYKPDDGGSGYPYTPVSSCEDERGLLLQKLVYKQGGTLVETEQNTYNYNQALGDPNYRHIYGLKAGQQRMSNTYSGNCPAGPGWSFSSAMYKVNQFWPVLASTRQTLYSSAGIDSLTTTTRFYYDTVNGQVIKKTFLTSKGDSLINYSKFASNFSGTPVYDQMLIRNMVALPVETDDYRNAALVAKKVINYAVFPGQLLLADSVQLQEGGGALETRLLLNKYDKWGNLVSFNKSQDAKHVYLYGYQQVYPIAEVVNADSGAVAYTSFEDGTAGAWSLNAGSTFNSNNVITGNFVCSGGVTKTVPAGNYIISCWAAGSVTVNGQSVSALWTSKRDGSWHYYEWNLTNVSSVQVQGGSIDEVRLYPAGAQMITYTYQPLAGMTSQCDAGGHITYYEYDGLQRLLRVRDMDYNILKQYSYQYQVYATTAAVWRANGQIRCKPCPANSSYITNMQQHAEMDVNAQSVSYNTLRWVDDGVPGSCVINPDWQNTTTPLRCQVSGSNNTGSQEQEQKDMNPCSPTYNQTQWVVVGTNLTACPTCSSSNCSAPSHKCINGVCVAGVYSVVNIIHNGPACTVQFKYTFPDGSVQTGSSSHNPCDD